MTAADPKLSVGVLKSSRWIVIFRMHSPICASGQEPSRPAMGVQPRVSWCTAINPLVADLAIVRAPIHTLEDLPAKMPPTDTPFNPRLRFDDGDAYEQMMGRWSALV